MFLQRTVILHGAHSDCRSRIGILASKIANPDRLAASNAAARGSAPCFPMKTLSFSRLSLPLQLLLVLALVLPLLWSLLAFDLYRSYKVADTSSRTQARNLARAFAEEVKSSINSIDYTLVDLREEWQARPSEFAELVRRRQAFLERDVGFQVAILNEDGILVFSSVDASAMGQSFRDREHFQVHRQNFEDRLFISKPILGRISQRWSIQFTRPLHDARGSFAGVIVLSVSPDYFSRFYETIDLGKDGTILLARSDGEILARSPNPELALGKFINIMPPPSTKSTDSGVFTRQSPVDNISRVYGWRTLSKGDLVVTVGRSVDVIFASYRQQRLAYIFGGITLSFVLALIAYFLLSARKKRTEDETALRDSLMRLAAEQTRMKIILENSHDAFIAVDARGIVTDWNTRAEETFGWTTAEALGKDLNRLIVPPDLRAAHSAGLQRFIDTGRSTVLNRVLEVEALHRRGKRVPVELAIAGFHDGRNYVVTAFIRDITRRREAEKREAARAKSLEEARAALQHAQKLEAVGKLTGGVAHDFNNVLQIMGGNLQLLQMRFQGDPLAEKRIRSMLDAVDRGAKLSSHLLAFARRQPLKPQVVNLKRLLDDARDLLQQAVGGSVVIEISVAENLWNTLVDPNQLENVILNLALNARDAMDGAGSLRIELANTMLDQTYAASHPELSPGPYVLCKVSDTGSGMSPDVMEHVFEPFFTTKPPGQGTGLGLSMAYGFVKQSGGHIQLESQKGHGSTFRIYLPRSVEEETAAPLPVNDETVGGNETILVVEDDAEVGETVVATLGELGYQVLKAGNAQSALDILKSGAQIDLLFTDVVMPGPLRGPELAREAKRIAPEIVVLFTSGYTQNAIERGGRLDPDIHLLSKPYRREQLAQTLRQLLASKKREVLE